MPKKLFEDEELHIDGVSPDRNECVLYIKGCEMVVVPVSDCCTCTPTCGGRVGPCFAGACLLPTFTCVDACSTGILYSCVRESWGLVFAKGCVCVWGGVLLSI